MNYNDLLDERNTVVRLQNQLNATKQDLSRKMRKVDSQLEHDCGDVWATNFLDNNTVIFDNEDSELVIGIFVGQGDPCEIHEEDEPLSFNIETNGVASLEQMQKLKKWLNDFLPEEG